MTGDRPTTPGWHCHRCRSTSCRQRADSDTDHVGRVEYRPLLLTQPSSDECILAVVPHPLVSISETAGGHEGRWECQPHTMTPQCLKTQPSICGNFWLIKPSRPALIKKWYGIPLASRRSKLGCPQGPKKERKKEMGQPRSQHYMLSGREIEIVTRREGR